MVEYAACEIVMGVIGGVAVVLSVVLIVAYRSYKYEQELDSLLWKIDPVELKVRRPIRHFKQSRCAIRYDDLNDLH